MKKKFGSVQVIFKKQFSVAPFYRNSNMQIFKFCQFFCKIFINQNFIRFQNKKKILWNQEDNLLINALYIKVSSFPEIFTFSYSFFSKSSKVLVQIIFGEKKSSNFFRGIFLEIYSNNRRKLKINQPNFFRQFLHKNLLL